MFFKYIHFIHSHRWVFALAVPSTGLAYPETVCLARCLTSFRPLLKCHLLSEAFSGLYPTSYTPSYFFLHISFSST